MDASDVLIGRAPLFLEALSLIQQVARYDVPVLIEGETGTGKEFAARAIHYGGARRDAAFVPLNCGAIPEALIESELFGHERGAFTDARTAVPGLVEVADRGTLFLDEVDSLSPRAQVSLLRFLQDQRYRPLGGRVDRQSDVRIIAASNKRLEDLVDAGAFRADLLFRLKLMFLVMPPLRSRPGDARLLADYFVAGLNVRYGKTQKKATPQLEVWLESQPWPGNVRELENVVHRQYILADRAEIAPPGPFPDAGRGQQGVDGSEINLVYRSAKAAALAEFDRTYLRTLLSHSGGNVTLAARVARKERRALGKLIRKYGLRPDRFRVAEATGS